MRKEIDADIKAKGLDRNEVYGEDPDAPGLEVDMERLLDSYFKDGPSFLTEAFHKDGVVCRCARTCAIRGMNKEDFMVFLVFHLLECKQRQFDQILKTAQLQGPPTIHITVNEDGEFKRPKPPPAFDMYREVASSMFGVPKSHVTESMRKQAKSRVFGGIYGKEPDDVM